MLADSFDVADGSHARLVFLIPWSLRCRRRFKFVRQKLVAGLQRREPLKSGGGGWPTVFSFREVLHRRMHTRKLCAENVTHSKVPF